MQYQKFIVNRCIQIDVDISPYICCGFIQRLLSTTLQPLFPIKAKCGSHPD